MAEFEDLDFTVEQQARVVGMKVAATVTAAIVGAGGGASTIKMLEQADQLARYVLTGAMPERRPERELAA